MKKIEKNEISMFFKNDAEILVSSNQFTKRLEKHGFSVSCIELVSKPAAITFKFKKNLSLEDGVAIYHLLEKENYRVKRFSFSSYDPSPISYELF